jgi:hypothetical protein
MRTWLVVFAVATAMTQAHAGAQQTAPGVAAELPSRLDSFLTANPNATRTTSFLRSLTAAGDVWDTEINSVRQAQICGQYYFPQAKLEQLIEIVAKGRAFLAAN